MKRMFAILLGLSLVSVVGMAADEPKGNENARKAPAKVLEKYDKNKDGKLDSEERAAMRKDREAEALKRFDKNNDGKLDEAEKATMNEALKKERGTKGPAKAGKGPKKEKN